MRYDKDQLERFVNDTLASREPSPGDQRAAAHALVDVLTSRTKAPRCSRCRNFDLPKALGIKGGRGPEVRTTSPDDPIYQAVAEYVAGEISADEAEQKVSDEIVKRRIKKGGKKKDKVPESSTIRGYIKQLQRIVETRNKVSEQLRTLIEQDEQ